MASEKLIGPPAFDENSCTWREYKKEVLVWQSFTNLPAARQGPALWMTLKGKAKEAVKDMELESIKSDTGIDEMIQKLDEVFRTDDNQAAYLAYRDFETYVRPTEMSMQDFIVKFESLNNEIKKYNMLLPEGVLAYRFLHTANLRDDEVKLCRATISEFKYKDMKAKILSLFGDKVQDNVPSIK